MIEPCDSIWIAYVISNYNGEIGFSLGDFKADDWYLCPKE